jgi:hypothetical protein
MADHDGWVVSWLPFGMRTAIRNEPNLPDRSVKRFNSEKEAVSFVMALDETSRRSVTLTFPGGQIAYLPSIELMFAEHQKKEG